MKPKLDMDKIAKGLRAQRRGPIEASGGYFGASQLVAEVQTRFRSPSGGGRPTDPSWTERRLVPFTPATLARLEEAAAAVRAKGGVAIEPLQLAGLLVEKLAASFDEATLEELTIKRRQAGQ